MKLLSRPHRYHFKEIDSTNAYIKREYKSLRDFTFVSSEYQTMGRGRNTRSWISDRNTNLLFSLFLKDEYLVKNFTSLSILSAVSVINVLKSYNIKNISLKWPNDVFINDKKVAGILLEGISEDNHLSSLIIGIGINVNQKTFDDNLLINPTSISNELNKKINLKLFKNRIYKSIKKQLALFRVNKSDYLCVARQLNYLKDKEVYAYINNKKTKVKVIDINEDNTLKVMSENKIINVMSDEITFHL